ncbi:MAG: hypothetical protein JNL12_01710 [Planctomycetes bacterium]|nr:hypothetical protein [Planctomycetota bacterium]
MAGLAAAAPSQSPGLSPPGTYALAEATLDNFTAVLGVQVDVKVYRPTGLPPSGGAPVLFYGPGGGSGSSGQIAAVPQHDALWRRLATSGLTVVYLQNEQESAPGSNFWQLRGAVVQWAMTNSATLNVAFGTQLDDTSPAVVAGWSLGAATVVQHVGADFGFGDFTDARVRGAVLFANPAIGAYGGIVSSSGLALVDKPVLAVFGTDDMGQPGSYTPGSPPASSPRGLGVQAMLGGMSPFVFGACFTDANHFEYGAQPAVAGSANAARIEVINGHVHAFVDLVLRGLPDCGVFAGSAWPGPGVAWSAQRCTPPIVSLVGAGCATSAGTPIVGTSGGAPRAGNASFGITLTGAPAGAQVISALRIGEPPFMPGVPIDGAPACALLHVVPEILWFGAADNLGAVTLALPLPAGPQVVGLSFGCQHATFDYAHPPFHGLPLPFGTSAALRVVIGN